MKDIETMRTMLLGRDSNLLSLFERVVADFERQIVDERKRTEDAEQSVRNLQARFPQQPPMSFKTEIGTKGK